ncbi:MAG: gliding motility lipoprotein GldH [Chitinophagales bacterium]
MKEKIIYICLTISLLLTIACDSNKVFEKNEDLASATWAYEDTISFDVPIMDTISRYNVFVNVRHTNEYEYRNLWIYAHTHFPSGKSLKTRIDLPLADKEGKWYGKGLGEIINTQILIQPKAMMTDTGTYRFELEQNMRQNPLPNMMSVGLRVEKAN